MCQHRCVVVACVSFLVLVVTAIQRSKDFEQWRQGLIKREHGPTVSSDQIGTLLNSTSLGETFMVEFYAAWFPSIVIHASDEVLFMLGSDGKAFTLDHKKLLELLEGSRMKRFNN